MGIFINLQISRSVTKEEWKKVYDETLQLVKAFPLAEIRKERIHGVDLFCIVPTQEREEPDEWDREKTQIGWEAVGDYITMKTAEENYLPRDLVEEDAEEDSEDILYERFVEWDKCDEWSQSYHLWGNKTQGRPYHLYMLVIGCLIEDRLKEKAVVYGDITRGQCKRAVELANEHLQKPIDMPDRCYAERLLKRVAKMPVSEKKQMEIFDHLYLGTKDAEYGKAIREHYSDKSMDKYWKKRFREFRIGTCGFDDVFYDYILWGFDLGKMCGYVQFHDEEQNPQYEKLVKRIMDAKLHRKDKNTDDMLRVDQEEEEPYTIWTLMARFALGRFKNKKIDRYIPLEEIRKALKEAIGEQCDVDKIIDEYIIEENKQSEISLDEMRKNDEKLKEACEQDPSEAFSKVMNKKNEELKEKYEKYDISESSQLKFYEKGDTLDPALKKAIGEYRVFMDSLFEEEYYKHAMEKDAQYRKEWLIENNKYILLRDKDWEKIFTDVEEHKESFARYYPAIRVDASKGDNEELLIALMTNDEFYAYSTELMQQIRE